MYYVRNCNNGSGYAIFKGKYIPNPNPHLFGKFIGIVVFSKNYSAYKRDGTQTWVP